MCTRCNDTVRYKVTYPSGKTVIYANKRSAELAKAKTPGVKITKV